MTALSYDNLFERAQAGQAGFVEVPMDGARIVILAEGQSGAIATRRLGGCSGLVILGRSAAIMAHIAPRPPTVQQSATASQQHFQTLLGQVEQLYVTYRGHFPLETTGWGFYVAGFSDITDELKAIANQRFTALGLNNQHTYYNVVLGANRRDEVRACVQLLGPGATFFYIEQRLIEDIRFPAPLPDRQASQRTGHASQRNFLAWSDSAGRSVQMFYGRQVEPDFGRLSGIYDVYRADAQGRGTWLRFDFSTGTWIGTKANIEGDLNTFE
ncbi:hypothetical protein LTR49_027544 [Elasticomyces elasticus]|nr:hypothetical protein LTR49_027544 [Elasticomyces elasticus]